ncbi:Zinc finger, FYVE/PHD-type [Moelleriella libera RCEF 2490]|uniref:Zinc finger, FYVE/PHD-type n=1 Tax=Moelleriella libera RCEF 2490 TaxID=1081109 RepID=A0A166U841_9HYPO|nr:Zinc finger, FYVE/PHD-type [Moelleriella libera RCEF 2490]
MEKNDASEIRKRALEVIEDDADPTRTPVSAKRHKVEETASAPSAATNGLKAIASAISGVFGYGSPVRADAQPNASWTAKCTTPDAVQPLSSGTNGTLTKPAVNGISTFKRPAIKLAALKGTIWDNGDLPTSSRKGSVPNRPSASAPQPKPKPKPKPATNKGDALSSPPGLGVQSSPRIKTPKGILTPTKKRGRPRKNVTFNNSGEAEVFFEDLPKTPSARKSRMTKAQKAQKEDDGIVCEICSKPESKAPNEIVLCDNCDFSVHQLCYDLAEIPEGEWLCRSCLQEDVLKATPKPADASEKTAAAVMPADVPDIPNLEQHLGAFQRVLLDRCHGRRRIRLYGHDEPYEKAKQLVEQTVVAGEGNSLLLIGPRGCGKTTVGHGDLSELHTLWCPLTECGEQLVENVIVDLSKEHRHEFHTVRLNGFIHTDDKLALKHIWRQLGKEMEVEDDLLNRGQTNYADTMASLLALLSHPSEITGTDEGLTSQSVIFVIDEFDMFATHARQTLLYNLFDIAQSRKAPIAVLGCTTRLDVVELLEKRVKSRFSHRYIYLAPPKSLPAYWQICRQGLMIDRRDADKEGIDTGVEGYSEFHSYWTRKIEELYKQRQFQHLLQYHFFTSKSALTFLTEWILPLSRLSAKDLTLSIPAALSPATSLAAPDSRLQLLSTLSDLDLAMLIAAARLDIVAHTDTVNFAMAYDEYSSLVARQRVRSSVAGMRAMGGQDRVWTRGVAGLAWERLILLGLLVPAGIGGGRALGHGGLDGRMWKVDVALEEVPWAVRLGPVLARWCRDI